MAYTKTIMQRSPTRNTIKVVASAQADSTTLYLQTAVTTTTGNVTFNAPTTANPGGTIVRASGSWLTDFTNANFAGGGGVNALGQYVYVVTAGANAANIKSYNIVGFATTSTANDTAIISQFTPVVVTQGPIAVTANSYYSDLITAGQTIVGTGSVYINKIWASTVTGGGSIITRNSVIAMTLYGGGGTYGFEGSLNVPVTDNATSDIVLTWQTGSTNGGSIILELAKVYGFSTVDVYGTTT